MNLKEILSVSGLPGLYRRLATKKNGIVVESLENQQRKFLAARTYQFSPLESIAIYTHTDALPLEDVFRKMKKNPPPADTSKSGLRNYFLEILPDHDQSKVYASDIKKIVAWYTFLHDNNYLEEDAIKSTSEEE